MTPTGKKRISRALQVVQTVFITFFFFLVKRTEFQNSIKDRVLTLVNGGQLMFEYTPGYIYKFIIYKFFFSCFQFL